MIHASYNQGCYPNLGCGEDEPQRRGDPRGKRADAPSLAALQVACGPALHPYEPAPSKRDEACVSAILAPLLETRQAGIAKVSATVTTVRAAAARPARQAYA